MAITVVLAVGWDPWYLAAQNAAWRAAGYIAVSASSTDEALRDFKAGDFDLVLLGESISCEEQQSLTRQIRATGAKVPVIDTSHLPCEFSSLEQAAGRTTTDPISVSSAKWPYKHQDGYRLAS